MRFFGFSRSTRLPGVLLVVVGLASCTEPSCDLSLGEGEHVRCREGEPCSDLTPDGVSFRWPETRALPTATYPATALAVGGHVTLSVARPGTEPDLPPFDLHVDERVVRGTVVDARTLDLEGVAEGSVELRLTEAGNDRILDRTTVEVRAVERSVLLPACGALVSPPDGGYPRGLLAGGRPVTVVARLRDAQGRDLIDQTLAFDPPGSAGAWNARVFDVPPAGALTVGVTSATTSAMLTLPVHADVDGYLAEVPARAGDIAPTSLGEGRTISLTDGPHSFCAVALGGGDRLCNAPASAQLVQEGRSIGLATGCLSLGQTWFPVKPGAATLRVGVERPSFELGVIVEGATFEVTFVE